MFNVHPVGCFRQKASSWPHHGEPVPRDLTYLRSLMRWRICWRQWGAVSLQKMKLHVHATGRMLGWLLKNTEYPKQTTQAQGCQGRVPICEFQQRAITKKDEAPCRSTNHPNLDVAGSPIDHIEEVTNTSHVSGSLFCTVLFHAFKMDTTTARQCTDTESKRAAGHCAIGFDMVFNFSGEHSLVHLWFASLVHLRFSSLVHLWFSCRCHSDASLLCHGAQ